MTEPEYRRLQYLPVAIMNAERKLAALRREAARYGLRELTSSSEQERAN